MERTIDPEGAELDALGETVDFGGLRVLEVGCGDGRLTWRYAAQAASVVGVDPDAEAISKARAATPAELAEKVRFEVAGVAELEQPPLSVDLVFFSWSL